MYISGGVHTGASRMFLYDFTLFHTRFRAFPHYLDVGLLPSDFIFSSVPGPFLRDDEDIGRYR